jgi:hypothetical protein
MVFIITPPLPDHVSALPLSAADRTGIHHDPGRTNNKKYAVYTTLAKTRSDDIAFQLTGETAVALPL